MLVSVRHGPVLSCGHTSSRKPRHTCWRNLVHTCGRVSLHPSTARTGAQRTSSAGPYRAGSTALQHTALFALVSSEQSGEGHREPVQSIWLASRYDHPGRGGLPGCQRRSRAGTDLRLATMRAGEEGCGSPASRFLHRQQLFGFGDQRSGTRLCLHVAPWIHGCVVTLMSEPEEQDIGVGAIRATPPHADVWTRGFILA